MEEQVVFAFESIIYNRSYLQETRDFYELVIK